MAIGIESFEIMFENIVLFKVTVKDDMAVAVERYCSTSIPCSIQLNSKESLMRFFSYETFDKNRPDLKELLRFMGLSYYQPYFMCYKMHGLQSSAHNWLRFEGHKNLTYEEAWADLKSRIAKYEGSL